VFDARVVPDLVDEGDEVGQCDDHLGLAVLEQVADLAGLVLRVHRNDDPAGPKRPVERDHELRQVGEIERDAVVLADAALLECCRKRTRLPPELLVARLGP